MWLFFFKSTWKSTAEFHTIRCFFFFGSLNILANLIILPATNESVVLDFTTFKSVLQIFPNKQLCEWGKVCRFCLGLLLRVKMPIPESQRFPGPHPHNDVFMYMYISLCSLGGLIVPPQHLEEGVLEAVLLSMGRTMTREEVKQLMQRTVQQVAGTLSLDLDRAEHLLIHCKWNVDLLIQRYTDDPDALVLAAGLKIRNPQPAPGPVAQCPVCFSQFKESDPPPMLSCMHYCCGVSAGLKPFRDNEYKFTIVLFLL